MTWLSDIETVPRDGSPILLWLRYPDAVLPSDDGPVVGQWSQTGWWLSRNGETAWPERFISHFAIIEPPGAA